MFEKIFCKKEQKQEQIQTEQKMNDKDCELTDEELEQITGGARPDDEYMIVN